jgi:hypothetical protein
MGKEHYTKNTVEVAAFCLKHGRETPHEVHGGRKGACKWCLAEQTEKAKNRPPEPKQENLF